jgi:hypothetical protein
MQAPPGACTEFPRGFTRRVGFDITVFSLGIERLDRIRSTFNVRFSATWLKRE